MKLVVWKNYLGGQILYRSLGPPIKNGVKVNWYHKFTADEVKTAVRERDKIIPEKLPVKENRVSVTGMHWDLRYFKNILYPHPNGLKVRFIPCASKRAILVRFWSRRG